MAVLEIWRLLCRDMVLLRTIYLLLSIAFMNVPIDGETGKLMIKAPITKAGDHVDFRAEMDLIIAITACSAPRSNDGVMKPIRYRVTDV